MNASHTRSPGELHRTQTRAAALAALGFAVLLAVSWVINHTDWAGLGGGERFVIPYEPSLDLGLKDVTFSLDGLDASLSMSRPPRPQQPLRFELSISKNGQVLKQLRPELSFNMDMDMGRFRVMAEPNREEYVARVVLPVCLWGGKRWYARLRWEWSGRWFEKVVLFDMR